MSKTNLTERRRYAPITAGAQYLGCSEKTIRRYIAAGRLTGYRVGPKMIRVDLNEIDAMLSPVVREAS